jgi:osmotically-inducible protein OsmY
MRTRTLLLLSFLISSAGFAQTEAIDLTALFRAGGIDVDRRLVYQVSDIILIRGGASDIVMAAQAGRFAKSLGYERVANLIEIVPGLADSAIERYGTRELDIARELEGCDFQIQSIAGVVRVTGHVRREVQGDLAIAILRKIDGVEIVHSELVSMKSPAGQQE